MARCTAKPTIAMAATASNACRASSGSSTTGASSVGGGTGGCDGGGGLGGGPCGGKGGGDNGGGEGGGGEDGGGEGGGGEGGADSARKLRTRSSSSAANVSRPGGPNAASPLLLSKPPAEMDAPETALYQNASTESSNQAILTVTWVPSRCEK